jgi:hypothetical protein
VGRVTAEPSPADPRLDALEARVADLEQYQGHVLPFVQAATGTAVAKLHGDLQALQQEVSRHGQRLDQVEAGLATVERLQIEHGAALGTVAGKVDGLERRLDAHADVLASVAVRVDDVAGRVDDLAGKVDDVAGKVGDVAGKVDGHGGMLVEILRRLPPAGD